MNNPAENEESTELLESDLQELQKMQDFQNQRTVIQPISDESTLITEPIRPVVDTSKVYPMAATPTPRTSISSQSFHQQASSATASTDAHDNTVVGILITLAGVGAIIMGGRSLYTYVIVMSAVGKMATANPLTGFLALAGFAVAACTIAFGIGFLLKRNWGRVLAIGLYSVSILLSLPMVFANPLTVIAILVDIAIITILNLNAVKNQFS